LLAVVDKPLVHSLPPTYTGKHLKQYIVCTAYYYGHARFKVYYLQSANTAINAAPWLIDH